jgi:hypothetical protein
MTTSASFKKKHPRFFSERIHAPADSFISNNEGMNACLSGLHTHPPVLVFFYEQGINPLAIGADVLDAIV